MKRQHFIHVAIFAACLSPIIHLQAQDIILDATTCDSLRLIDEAGNNIEPGETAFDALVIRMTSPASGVSRISFNREQDGAEFELGTATVPALSAGGDQRIPLTNGKIGSFVLLPVAGLDIISTCAQGPGGTLHFPGQSS